MEIWYFERIFKDLTVQGKNKEINLRELVVRSRGTCRIDGYEAVNFEAVKDDMDPIFLRPESIGDGTYCLCWDDQKRRWDNLGRILLANEWSMNYFKLNWKSCGIHIVGKGVIALTDLFSECLGDRFDGLIFLGRGELEGERFILRLDTDTRLANFYDNQICEKYDRKRDDWEFWGMLVKKLPKKK